MIHRTKIIRSQAYRGDIWVKQEAYLAKTKVPDTMEWSAFLQIAQISLKQKDTYGTSRAINESSGSPTLELEDEIWSSSNTQHNGMIFNKNRVNLTIALIPYWGITDRKP